MTQKLCVVTGGAGFIGVTLTQALLARDHRVLLIDNLSRGRREYVEALGPSNRVSFRQADVSVPSELKDALENASAEDVEVWHLCANSDIPAGIADPHVDLRDTFMVTFTLLEEMRRRGWRTLHFASTSAVYGDHGTAELTETTFVEPISNYGAMKLASEAFIRAACEVNMDRANVFRFPNVVGTPATHGVILDFIHKLKRDPTVLPVLGNGSQRKAYLHVQQLIEAMMFIRDHGDGGYRVFNIGPKDIGITVREIAEIVRDRTSPNARIDFGSEDRGWVGDVPRFTYNTDKLTKLGWSASMSSRDAVLLAVDQIATQEGVPPMKR
jgi:UDP-glucose 4-epimerase